MIDYNTWKSNIISAIEDLADRDYQKNVWLGKSKDQQSSFDEDIMMLYDSHCFNDDFWNINHLPNFNFTDSQIDELTLFKRQLDMFISKNKEKIPKPTDKEIINDHEWIAITESAKKILDSLK